MTISIKPTASGSTIEQDGSTILTVDGSGNITPSNNLYPKVPAFCAYRTSNQSISANTQTKVAWNTKRFDTNSNYDATTNYRFTPTVAGYYLVHSTILVDGQNTGFLNNHIYKNGSSYLFNRTTDDSTSDVGSCVTALVYMNGTTDYLENYIRHNTNATTLLINTSELGEFSAYLVSV